LLDNTFDELVLSFSNEVAQICEHYNINAFKLIEAANHAHSRNTIPAPAPTVAPTLAPGINGRRLSRDPNLYCHPIENLAPKPVLGQISRSINARGAENVLEKLNSYCSEHAKSLQDIKIFIVGLASQGTPAISEYSESTALPTFF